ncbi:MAG: hypothetical protein IJM27_07110 [Eubacterium sp.]|nr:hypothetical protein [Eubacterium sp.]
MYCELCGKLPICRDAAAKGFVYCIIKVFKSSATVNQASHNSEGRNQGIIVGAIGIIVAFALQITNMILGK